jgi:RNA polymerase sigma-70 factor, ECF subfamily
MTERDLHFAWDEHGDAVYRFALRMTGSPETAEDILQECFLALVRNPGLHDSARAPLRPFLLAIARNQIRKRWQREQRWAALDEDAGIVEPVDPQTGETAELVARAVQSLPPLQREVLVLFEYEELSLEEIARSVDAEIGAVKSRLSRARNNLRQMLAPLRGALEWNH